MKIYDFRSDTVTHPTPEMRQAMANAQVGDDVYGEDPTINTLEAKSARLMGKEAALFVTSGTMGNLLAVLASCARGDEVIMGRQGHTFLHEAGGVSALGGVVMNTIPNQVDGTLALADLEAALRSPDDIHQPISKMIIIENTQNDCGGVPLSVKYCDEVGKFAKEHSLVLHLDGARIFNAAISLNVQASDLTRSVDSVTFCLSKGLCAPVGSVLCGSSEFIAKARRLRKMLGGGMRQAGILAAAGLVALDCMSERMAEDHKRARLLAKGLADVPGLSLDKRPPYTHLIYLALEAEVRMNAPEIVKAMEMQGMLKGDTGPRTFRLVTHHDVDDEAVAACIEAFQKVMSRAV